MQFPCHDHARDSPYGQAWWKNAFATLRRRRQLSPGTICPLSLLARWVDLPQAQADAGANHPRRSRRRPRRFHSCSARPLPSRGVRLQACERRPLAPKETACSASGFRDPLAEQAVYLGASGSARCRPLAPQADPPDVDRLLRKRFPFLACLLQCDQRSVHESGGGICTFPIVTAWSPARRLPSMRVGIERSTSKWV
jgi:hypothetical protein